MPYLIVLFPLTFDGRIEHTSRVLSTSSASTRTKLELQLRSALLYPVQLLMSDLSVDLCTAVLSPTDRCLGKWLASMQCAGNVKRHSSLM